MSDRITFAVIPLGYSNVLEPPEADFENSLTEPSFKNLRILDR